MNTLKQYGIKDIHSPCMGECDDLKNIQCRQRPRCCCKYTVFFSFLQIAMLLFNDFLLKKKQ